MPVNQIVDPQAESTEAAIGAQFTAPYLLAGTTRVAPGHVLKLLTVGTTGHLRVEKASVTSDFKLVGFVAVPSRPVVTPGTLVRVITGGPTQVLIRTAATYGDLLISTTAHVGFVKCTAAGTTLTGKVIGVCLQTSSGTTITTTVRLVWAYVAKM